MVIKYENGKIYKIIGNVPTDPCYVGSTTKDYLSQRLTKHVYNYNSWIKDKKENKIMSFELFDKYGVENCKIILLEIVKAKTKDELRQREQYYIDQLECVNKKRAHSSQEDIKKYQQNWTITNKERLQRKSKNYYVENKSIINTKMKEYRHANIDIIREKNKLYALNQGKATIQAYRVKTYHCNYCDNEYNYNHKSRHERTSRHINNTIKYMKSIIDKYTEQINTESNIIQHFSLE